ncbi:hypothetical protein K0M31_001130 [Melipona bicolor]|uniref:Uncharacterized protein n=1 Tax=Melipona bicolor TaxID=60889 RepID=A0AA40GFV0_9HYME|nr:hypothetical protein K0M31_001130 [Melipona bicolor]
MIFSQGDSRFLDSLHLDNAWCVNNNSNNNNNNNNNRNNNSLEDMQLWSYIGRCIGINIECKEKRSA